MWIKANARRFCPLASGRINRERVPVSISARSLRSGSSSIFSVVKTPRLSLNRSNIGAAGSTLGWVLSLAGTVIRSMGRPNRSNVTMETFFTDNALWSSSAVRRRICSSLREPLKSADSRFSKAKRWLRSSKSAARRRLSSYRRAFSSATAAWLACADGAQAANRQIEKANIRSRILFIFYISSNL